MFVDRVTIELCAGTGGHGCLSFRREKYVPKGGPDGGDGGNGGSIVVVAEAGIDSLATLAHRKMWKANGGGHGSGANRSGATGDDMIIKVPPGTVVRDAVNGFILKDLAEVGDRVTAARGGKGGRGNTSFKSSTNRAPRQFTHGERGETRRVEFELKVIADVGLVGRPNAGKSTLLSRMSRARPDIAAYPFTTKHPNLGKVQLDRERSFILADIPGLIKGAHQGHGLGHEFLRHIERAGILVHLVEPAPLDQSDPLENYRSIHNELVRFNEELGRRQEIVAVSKAELPGASNVQQSLAENLERRVLLISAVTGQGLDELRYAIAQALDRK